MKPKKKTPSRSFLNLSPAERDREVARFDRPIDIERDTRPLTAKQKALFELAMGRRPRSSADGPRRLAKVRVELDQGLLKRSARFALEHKMTLSELISRSLDTAMRFVGS
jgi:hypothetical protein